MQSFGIQFHNVSFHNPACNWFKELRTLLISYTFNSHQFVRKDLKELSRDGGLFSSHPIYIETWNSPNSIYFFVTMPSRMEIKVTIHGDDAPYDWRWKRTALRHAQNPNSSHLNGIWWIFMVSLIKVAIIFVTSDSSLASLNVRFKSGGCNFEKFCSSGGLCVGHGNVGIHVQPISQV